MRLATLLHQNQPTLGIIHPNGFVPVAGRTLLDVITEGESALNDLRQIKTPPISYRNEDLLTPIPKPSRNIMCIGLNYAEHVKESAETRGKEAKMPAYPVFFTKATNAVNGPFAPISLDENVSVSLDWEVELGVVIGKRGKNITAEKAFEYIFGYTIVNDVSARDLQTRHGQFFKGKSLDGTCPIGPWIVSKDEILDPQDLVLRCKVNEVIKQDSTTSQMIFKIPAIIEQLSLGMTLEPGDIIATGTPSGVGFSRQPPEFLRKGDRVECEIEGIGFIRNTIN